MELIYSMRRKPLKCEPPHFETSSDPEVVRPICTISACNIIAFSSPTELSDSDGCTWGGHVYVCDLDTPWDSHKVTSTYNPVSALEWDSEGKQLLVATTVGEVTVYGMKEFLLNEWTSLYSASFPGEHIIKAVFFHNGRRIVATEKKPDAPVVERLQMHRPTPTLKGFGGIACEGACIITATGLIGALTPASEAGAALSAAECLRPARDRVPAASVAHKNGNLVVAAGGHLCVRCAVCSVTLSRAPHQAPAVHVQPLPTVYLDRSPVSLTWCLREDTDSLLIAGTTLSVWKLTERSHPVHKLLSKGPLQGSTTPGGGQKPGSDCFNTVVWQQISVLPVDGACAHACSRRLHVAAPLHILAATGPNRLLLHRDTHRICSTAVVVAGPGAEVVSGTPPKKPKYGGALPTGAPCAIVSCVDMSWLGGACVAVDTHAQLHVYKLPQPDIPTALAVQHTTCLLEYAMVSGLDCRDVIMTLKPIAAEAVYERFTETFQRQPQPFQQYYFQNWLKLRIALCRVIPAAQGAVSSLTCLSTLACAWAALGVALRERDDTRPRHDADTTRLDALLDHDDKALIALEAKADLSSDAAALTPLRRVLQLCVDIAATTLQHAALHHSHPYETWTDGTALTLLRKLLLVVRATGRGGDALSRALARLQHQNSKEVREECAALCLQLPSPRVWESLPRCAVSAPHGRPWPHYFEYGVEPEALRYAPEPPNYGMLCDIVPSQGMDCIRYMYLGGGACAASWRQCGRCGARALPAARPARHALQKAYDGRFLAACRCGGKWTLVSNY